MTRDFEDIVMKYLDKCMDRIVGTMVYGGDIEYNIMKQDWDTERYFDTTQESKAFIEQFKEDAEDTYNYYISEGRIEDDFEIDTDCLVLCMLDYGVENMLHGNAALGPYDDEYFILTEGIKDEILKDVTESRSLTHKEKER